MQLPVIPPDLIVRIEQVWAAFWRAHLTGLANRPGNPLGVAVDHFGQAVALRAPQAAGDPWLNRVLCLSDADAGHLPQVLKAYRDQRVSAHLEVCPGLTGPGVLDVLADEGCRQVGWHAVTYGVPEAELPASPPDVTVTEVDEPADAGPGLSDDFCTGASLMRRTQAAS